MADWLTSLIQDSRRKELEALIAKELPPDNRTKAQIIYRELPNPFDPRPSVLWRQNDDETVDVRPVAGVAMYSAESSDGQAAPPAQGGSPNQPVPAAAPADNPSAGSSPSGQPSRGVVNQAPAIDDSTLPPDARPVDKTPGDQEAGVISTNNDTNNSRVIDRRIDKTLAGIIEAYVWSTGKSVNINSTVRNGPKDDPNSPHYSGVGIDVNRINGIKVDPNNPHLRELVDFVKNHPDATQVFGPKEAVIKVDGKLKPIGKLIKSHQDHIHIGTIKYKGK